MSGRGNDLLHLCAARLLEYPSAELVDQVDAWRAAVRRMPAAGAAMLGLLDRLATAPLTELQAEYVETFDLRRRCSLFLTYYSYGDTRKRGAALLRLKQTYRAHGVLLSDAELPDHLSVVLEFAATVDEAAGRQILVDHRAGLELLGIALRDGGSPYHGPIAAVSATLPPLRGEETQAVRRLIANGPPEEGVGLEPYGGPTLLTLGATRLDDGQPGPRQPGSRQPGSRQPDSGQPATGVRS